MLLVISQSTALETYDRRIAIVATQSKNQLPENEHSSCTFICLKLAEKFLELQPVSKIEEIKDTFILTTFSIFRWKTF